MTYPTEVDILELKKAEQAAKAEKPAGIHWLPLLLLLALPFGGVLAWVLAAMPAPLVPYAPVSPLAVWTATPTLLPTPTLKPTAVRQPTAETATQTPTAVTLTIWNVLPTLTAPPATWTPQPTHTPFPTWTPQPTWTPAATTTPRPTHTPFPTWTPQPTWTPAAVALNPAETRQADVVATWEVTPPAGGGGPAVWAYVLGGAASTTLLILSLAVLAWARNQRPVPIQLLAPPSPVETAVSPEPLPSSGGGAWRLPPPPGEPVREGVAPVRTGAITGVTGAAPVQEPVGGPETITIRIMPDDPQVDEAVMRAICEVWKRLERPSFTKVCHEYFGGKNSDRLAIVRRAVEWGRANGLIQEENEQ